MRHLNLAEIKAQMETVENILLSDPDNVFEYALVDNQVVKP